MDNAAKKDTIYHAYPSAQTSVEVEDFSLNEKPNSGFNETANTTKEPDLIANNFDFYSNEFSKTKSKSNTNNSFELISGTENNSTLILNENPALKRVSKKIQKASSKLNSSSSEGQGSAGLRAIGWVILILGILILLFASILIGGFLMLLGLIFVIAGAKKGSESRRTVDKSDSNYIDVVYLKNGGLVRGMIIEQMPNVQLKIQTRDGNVFVYKMDEIEKIAKELEKK
jgi:hypothetical protein